MNILDILIICVLLYAVYSGCREGLVVQILSIVGMVLSVWAGSRYSNEAAKMLHIEGDYSGALGFLVATVVVLIAIAIAARILRKFLNLAGVGLVDVILGAVLSVCKFVLILSLAFTAVNMANKQYKIFDADKTKASRLYMPIANLSNHFTPVWNWANEQINKQ